MNDKHDRPSQDEHYSKMLYELQVELVKLQRMLIADGKRVLIILEGRDGAGKDGTIKRLTEHMSPRETRVHAPGVPSSREATEWYFQRFVPFLPAGGEFVVFNRSWYNRAGVERVMGFCTEAEYLEFMRDVPQLERMLVRSGLHLIKFWFSVARSEQRTRFAIRQLDPVRRWKLSPTDIAALDLWDAYTAAKEAMFAETDTAEVPWTMVKSNDKKRARVEAMRWVLSRFDYTDKDEDVVGTPDPLIVLPASQSIEPSEHRH